MNRMMTCILSAIGLMPLFAGNLTERISGRYRVKTTDVWQGGQRTVFDFNGYDAWVVEPPKGVEPSSGMPWTWTMQWRDSFVPRTAVPRMLRMGWHHVSIDTFKDRMDEAGLSVSKSFQDFLVKELGLAPKACLIGMSWGGFFSVRYAAHNPQCVSKIYLDCPYLNLSGCCRPLNIGSWAAKAPENWIDDPRMPINMAHAIADAKIPILLAYGGADNILDPKQNSEVFIPRFKAAGGDITVVYRESYGHHPHGFEESEMIIPNFFSR